MNYSNFPAKGARVACLILMLVFTEGEAQIATTIEGPSLRDNIVKLRWSPLPPQSAVTVETTLNLRDARWSPVPSRYHWPAPITNWGETRSSAGGEKYYRVVTTPIGKSERGKLASVTFVRSVTPATLKSHFSQVGLPSIPNPKYPIQIYKIVYESIDGFGLPTIASGALLLPVGRTNAAPLLSFQHPTELSRLESPSRAPTGFTAGGAFTDFVAGEFFAGDGFGVLMADYIGMGDSPGFPPWVHAKTEAAAIIDLFRASRAFFVTNGFALNGQLFLAGYSQGARASLAAQREIESLHAQDITVTATAGLAGSYDLPTLFDFMLSSTNYSTSFLLPYWLAAYLQIYQLADTLEELLAAPFDRSLPPLLDGLHNYNDFSFLPSVPAKILKPDVLAEYRNNPDTPLRRALQENSVLDWKPIAPVLLLHGSGDAMVPFSISEIALKKFQTNGACCVTLVDPGARGELDHFTIYGPGLTATRDWLNQFVR